MLEPGQVFAVRYRVIQLLASGGMGAVFEARHTGTERRVAIKLLWPQVMAVASAREKFELEAKVAARVNSEHIVHVSDAGFDEGTQSPYLVMELLEGQTLAARVQEGGPLGADEVVALLSQVAAGLDAAHGYRDERGALSPIVHRDLKPENLFIAARRDGAPLMKILDFGIAKVLSESTNVSQEVKGTPLYMAFEQLTAGVLSPQTDIWALGLITYYVLTGRRYWRSAQTPGAGVQSIFGEILSLPMDVPSVRIRQQGSDLQLPAGFDAWLLKCLDREPQRRYGSAGEAIEELARALEGAPRAARARVAKLTPELGMSATATFLASPGELLPPSTGASLPGVASDHGGSAPVRFALTPSWRVVGVLLAAGVTLVTAMFWFISGDDSDSQLGARPPGPAAAPVRDTPPPPAVAPSAVRSPPGASPGVRPLPDPPPDAPEDSPNTGREGVAPSTTAVEVDGKPTSPGRPGTADTTAAPAEQNAVTPRPGGQGSTRTPGTSTPVRTPRQKDTKAKPSDPYDTTGFGKAK